jgi:type IV pilus assembly protein PilB
MKIHGWRIKVSAKKLGELLVQEKIIDPLQLEQAMKEQRQTGGKLTNALVKLGYADEAQITSILAKQYNVPAIDLNTFTIDTNAVKKVNKTLCEKYLIIPISVSGTTLVVAMADPSNIFVKDDLTFLTKCKIQPVVASESAIRAAIDRSYDTKVSYESIMTEMEKDSISDAADDTVLDLEDTKDEAPVVQFVNLMLSEAIKMKASDIHIEPYEKNYRVRFRIDGALYEKIQPPSAVAPAISSRIKIMSKMDISERRRPQDGRLKIKTKSNKEMDFRVSILPSLFGEKIVLRLLDKSNLQLDMTKLGFEADDLQKFKAGIYKPHGMALITGPTGSGKTTTIYSALAELNTSDVNISTAEDPVEFNLEGINQVQMNREVELDFAAALRSFLRQDPDILMVGEIRDLETAEVAFKAALTGHLVVSTLHTNDATSTIHRLIDMGVEPFLVSSALNVIVAQRLVRKNCDHCKDVVQVDPALLKDMGVPENEISTYKIMKGDGCARCNDTGYKGRIAIYEVLEMNESIKQAVYDNASVAELKAKAIKLGMRTLRMSGLLKLKQGLTSVEEVLTTSARD